MSAITAGEAVAFDAQHATEFLTAVYAGRPGLLQVCSTGDWTGRFFDTTPAGIAAVVRHAQALDDTRPQGIYHRATTLAEQPAPGKRGGAEHTADTPILWGDVDFGTDGHEHDPAKHDGLTLPPDRAAAELVIAESGLAAPTILTASGGGLYPEWQLDRPVDVATAAELSARVQALLLAASLRHGWHYGTGVKDLARVLRLPGTVNRKLPGHDRPCRVVGGSGQLLDPATIPELPTPVVTPTTAAPRALALARPYDPTRTAGPFDAFAEHASWADILEPADWTFVGWAGSGPDRYQRWLRPGGASSADSAHAYEHVIVVHSDNAGLPTGAGQRLTKGRLFAHLHYRGDYSAAAVDLTRAAHGNGGTPAAQALPPAVLAAIHAVTDDSFFGLDRGDVNALVEGRAPTAPQATPPTPGAPAVPDTQPAPEQAPRSRLWGNVLAHDSLRGDPPPEPPYVLDDLVRQGDLVALVSAAKAGKSLLTLDRVLAAVAHGRHIVYLDAENGLRIIHSRVHALGHSRAPLDGLVYVAFPSLVLDEPGGARELIQFIAELHHERPVDLVVLDTASRFLAGEENDAGPWLAQYRLALLPLKREGIAVLRLDHLGKDPGKGARGSSAKSGDVDAVFELVPETSISVPGQPQRLTLTCTMQRSGNYPPYQTLVRGEVRGVLGHHHPGDFVGTTPVLDPGDPADRIVRALDEVEAPTGTGRDKAKQLVGHRFPNTPRVLWETAIRRRKDAADLAEEAAREPARDTPSQTHLPGQVSADRAGTGRSGVSAGQTCPGRSGQNDEQGTAGRSQHPEGVRGRAAPGQAGGQSQPIYPPQMPTYPPDATAASVDTWRVTGQPIAPNREAS